MNYREKYKNHFGIEFGSEYVVHHIDFDRRNNDISNLLLLPKELHAKYHLIINALTVCPEKPKADGFIDVRISNMLVGNYGITMFEQLPEVIAECQNWLNHKLFKYDFFIGKRRTKNGNI